MTANLSNTEYDAIFAGVIGQEYELLTMLSPLSTEMSRLVGLKVAEYSTTDNARTLQVLELGGGTGITTLAILTALENVHILSVDVEPVMQDQAKRNLLAWTTQNKLAFLTNDALSALQSQPSDSFDVIASGYTLHNFVDTYRAQVIPEIFRVLKPGGQFINGDRYALDDCTAHTRHIQEEVGGYFKVLIPMQKFDVLQQWIVHIFSDESENHIMRERPALEQLQSAGFCDVKVQHRMQVNALITATKPR